MTVSGEEAPANFVPAAAVIRRGLALFGITGRKAHVGGFVSRGSNPRAQPWNCLLDCKPGGQERRVEYRV